MYAHFFLRIVIDLEPSGVNSENVLECKEMRLFSVQFFPRF